MSWTTDSFKANLRANAVQILGKRYEALGLIAILLFSGCFLLLILNRPFTYDSEGFGSAYGVMARNYFNHGWTETLGMPVLTMGRNPEAPIVFYRDHPPLVPLAIAAVYRLFGIGEWQTRLPAAAFTLLAVVALFVLFRRNGSARLGLLVAAVYAAMPINLYFGALPEVVGQPLVLFTVLSVLAYLNFHRETSYRNLALLVGILAMAGASDWPAFIIVPVYLAHFLVTKPLIMWPRILLFCLAACTLFAMLYTYIAVATNAPWDWMIPLFLNRSGIGHPELAAADWLATALKFNLSMHTLPVLIASGAWLILLGRRSATTPRPETTTAMLLLGWGLLHVIIGRQGVYIHSWWWSPLSPGLAATAALGMDAVTSTINRWIGRQHIGEAVVIGFLVLFACFTVVSSIPELRPANDGLKFSTRELGQAIQIAAPGRNEVALLVWAEYLPQEFFYGNRPLREGIWSVRDLKENLQGNEVTLMFGFEQPWHADAKGLVFPAELRSQFPELLRYLENHYQQLTTPQPLAGKLLVFNLQTPDSASTTSPRVE